MPNNPHYNKKQRINNELKKEPLKKKAKILWNLTESKLRYKNKGNIQNNHNWVVHLCKYAAPFVEDITVNEWYAWSSRTKHYYHDFFLHSWTLLYACIHPSDWEPRWADEVWEGVNDSDIITACRLVLFHCPHTDRSSIVPALRGLPRFPCVRNHPPTCYSRQGPKTMKLYTESLWAAGQGPDERQCGCGENNKRQAPTQSTFCTHTYLQRCRPATHIHT